MKDMFSDARGFNRPLGHWDTSRVTDMSGMFKGASAFNRAIGGWNTSRVNNMRKMFKYAIAFNQDIGRWDTSKVKDMSQMFYKAESFNQDIGMWDTSHVTTMLGMFEGAIAFNQPIGAWNTGRVKVMSRMFHDAHSFNRPIGAWEVHSVSYMRDMFRGARAFIQDIRTWASKFSSVWDVAMDDDTRLRVYGNGESVYPLTQEPVDPLTQAFTSRRYRLHPSANAYDPVMTNRVPLNDARVIAGDVVGNNARIRHIFHKDTLNAMARHGGGTHMRHPLTRELFRKAHIVPLRDVLHANDAAIYNRIGVRGRTIDDVRRNAKKKNNAR